MHAGGSHNNFKNAGPKCAQPACSYIRHFYLCFLTTLATCSFNLAWIPPSLIPLNPTQSISMKNKQRLKPLFCLTQYPSYFSLSVLESLLLVHFSSVSPSVSPTSASSPYTSALPLPVFSLPISLASALSQPLLTLPYLRNLSLPSLSTSSCFPASTHSPTHIPLSPLSLPPLCMAKERGWGEVHITG